MIRVILARIGHPPHVTWLSPDQDNDHWLALKNALGGMVACIALHDGVVFWCNREGLAAGLKLVLSALRANSTSAGSMQADVDFVLARVTAGGKLTDLPEVELKYWLRELQQALGRN